MEIEIGVDERGNPFKLDVQRHMIERGLAVLGIRGSGKSYTVGKICELLCEIGQPFVVIDIMGEYYTLRERYPVVVIAQGSPREYKPDIGEVTPEMAPAIARVCLTASRPVVLDLKLSSMLEKYRFLASFLETFYEEAKSREKMIPIILVMDEGHRLLPERSMIRLRELKQFQEKVMLYTYELAATGRHYGLGFIVVARRAAEISKSILTQTELKLWFKVTDIDLDRLREEAPKEVVEKVRRFKPGTAVVTGLPEPVIIHVHRRVCSHGGRTPLAKPVEIPGISEFKNMLKEALREAKPPPSLPKPILKELTEKTRRIRELESQNLSLRSQVSKLKAENESLRKQLTDLQAWLRDLEKKILPSEEVETLKLRISELEEENQALKSRISDLESQLSEVSRLEEKIQTYRELVLNLRDLLIEAQRTIPELEIVPADIAKLKEERDFYKRKYEEYREAERLETEYVQAIITDKAVRSWISEAKRMLNKILSSRGAFPRVLRAAVRMDPETIFFPEDLQTGVTSSTNREFLNNLAAKGLLWKLDVKGRVGYRNAFRAWVAINVRRIKPLAPDKAIAKIAEELEDFVFKA